MSVFPEENRIEKNQVYEADCVDVLKRLHSESVDLIIADEAVICGLTPEKACNFKEFAA